MKTQTPTAAWIETPSACHLVGETQQDRDRQIIDTIDKEARSIMCWTDEQQAAWYREIDRDQQGKTYQGGIWSDAHCNDFGEGKL